MDLQSTRGRILQIIRSREADTVGSIAHVLRLAPATVRRHLDILQRDGLVVFSEVRKGTGRPEHAFTLTESGQEAFPRGYDALLADLLREMGGLSAEDTAGRTGCELVTAAFERSARWAVESAVRAGNGRNGRVSVLTDVLSARKFAPETQKTDDGFRIILRNCPFRAVAMRDTRVCAYDAYLITETLGTSVRKELSIVEGHHCCSYVVSDARPVAAG